MIGRCKDCGGTAPGRHPRCDGCVWERPTQIFHRNPGRWYVTLNGRRRMLRSRWVMERHLGRPLKPDEHVHHVNGDRSDDRVENLRVLSPSDHTRLHLDDMQAARGAATSGQWSGQADACVECGTTARRHRGLGLCTRCHAAMQARRRANLYPHVCEECETAFRSNSRTQRFCSRSCASRATANARWSRYYQAAAA